MHILLGFVKFLTYCNLQGGGGGLGECATLLTALCVKELAPCLAEFLALKWGHSVCLFVFFLCQSEFILLPSGDMYQIKGF